MTTQSSGTGLKKNAGTRCLQSCFPPALHLVHALGSSLPFWLLFQWWIYLLKQVLWEHSAGCVHHQALLLSVPQSKAFKVDVRGRFFTQRAVRPWRNVGAPSLEMLPGWALGSLSCGGSQPTVGNLGVFKVLSKLSHSIVHWGAWRMNPALAFALHAVLSSGRVACWHSETLTAMGCHFSP